MRRSPLFLFALLTLSALAVPLLAAPPSNPLLQSTITPATREAVVALADKYLKVAEPKLTGDDLESVNSIKRALSLPRRLRTRTTWSRTWSANSR